MKKMALIGVTGFGSQVYKQWLRLHNEGEIDFAGAVVRTPAKCPGQIQEMKRLGVRVYGAFADLAADKTVRYDLLNIPTGIDSHESMVAAGLDYGANVLVEKPLTGTIDSARRMIARADASPEQWTAVGFQNLYGKDTRQVKKLLLAGTIGKVKKISVIGMWPRNTGYYTRNNWVARFKCGDAWVLDSPANNAFAHYIANALFWAADEYWDLAKIRTIQPELYRARDIETFDTCALRIVTANNVELIVHLTHSCAVPNHEPVIRIIGETGTIEWKLRGYYKIMREGEYASEIPVGDAFFDEFDEAAAKLNGDSAARMCPLRMAGKHTYTINALHMTGTIATIPPEFIRVAEDGTAQIQGIEDAFQTAWERGVLLSELGTVPWARPARQADVSALANFRLER